MKHNMLANVAGYRRCISPADSVVWIASVVLTLAANGTLARLVAGIADTVVVNNVHAVQMPMHVFDAAGDELPDTGIRFQWNDVSGN
jgi:hypothetical protein